MTHEDYLLQAVGASRLSPDPSTQNGAVLVARDGRVVSACNEPPPRVSPAIHYPEKYTILEHAERNVIYKAARAGVCTDGSTMYVMWYACPHCARAILCAGVREVIGLMALDVLTPERWREQVKAGKAILAEGGIRTRLYMKPLGRKVRFSGSEITV